MLPSLPPGAKEIQGVLFMPQLVNENLSEKWEENIEPRLRRELRRDCEDGNGFWNL